MLELSSRKRVDSLTAFIPLPLLLLFSSNVPIKGETMKTELNKIKIVLCALWDNQPYPDAQNIIDEFKKEIDEIERGN